MSYFFFFKQKTAYEMRISDWSSDVCSSDLFSGSHQVAIAKGFAAQKTDELWRVRYLPVDPQDLGRTYDSIVRVNSQSGKGGIAFLLQRDHGIVMPRRMQVEFSAIVQALADDRDRKSTRLNSSH